MQNPFDPGCYCSEELRTFGFKSIGRNVSISRTVEIYGRLRNIEIGDNVRIDSHCTLIATGPMKFGSYIHIGGKCHLVGRGGFTMEDFSGLSQNVHVYTASDDYLGNAMTNPMVPEHLTDVKVAAVHIGRHAIIGCGSVVLPGADLAEGVAVGALALVSRSLPEWGVYSGAPARLRCPRKRNPLTLERELRERLAA
jgi:acetyltransferase-like isoleucine patch superfamily enzyme